MANTPGEKELKRDWPNTTGIGADDKHEGRAPYLEPEGLLGDKNLAERDDEGLG